MANSFNLVMASIINDQLPSDEPLQLVANGGDVECLDRTDGAISEDAAPARKRKRSSSKVVKQGKQTTAANSKKRTKREIQQEEALRRREMESLTNAIKAGTFRKIAFLVGAGISVNAGIPDFRSPKSGLYAQVKKMGLPHPEDIFTLDCFYDDPRAFYHIAKEFFTYEAHPTDAHRFMKEVEAKKLLHMVYTQNIDGLEVDVGISEKKLVQAHGHMRSAHCCHCKKEYPIEEFFTAAKRDEILRCSSCNHPTHGIIKPHIIFFGEKLPRTFHTRLQKLEDADLIVVMGTSLKVKPFSTLLSSVPSTTPIVVINRDLPASCVREDPADRQIIFFPGDIEETVREMKGYLGW